MLNSIYEFLERIGYPIRSILFVDEETSLGLIFSRSVGGEVILLTS
jgi:hypothetical protein